MCVDNNNLVLLLTFNSSNSAFAQFQVNTTKNPRGDPKGPTVAEQVFHDPFERVVRHEHCTDMVVIQTTSYDPNTRFWCVIELFEVLKRIEERDSLRPFKIHYRFSKEFLIKYAKVSRGKKTKPHWDVKGNGEFVKVDPEGKGNITLDFLANPGGGSYEIFQEGDTVQITEDIVTTAAKTWDEGSSKLTWRKQLGLDQDILPNWPTLKLKIFQSHYSTCGWDKKFIKICQTPINGKDSWTEMQTVIAYNQKTSALEFEGNYPCKRCLVFNDILLE